MREEILIDDELPKATNRVLMQPGYHILRLFALKGELTWRVVLAVDAKDYAICELDGNVGRKEVAIINSLKTMDTLSVSGHVLSFQQAVTKPLEVFRGCAVEGKDGKSSDGNMIIWIEANSK